MSDEEVRGIRAAEVTEWFSAHIDGAAPPFRFSPIINSRMLRFFALTFSEND